MIFKIKKKVKNKNKKRDKNKKTAGKSKSESIVFFLIPIIFLLVMLLTFELAQLFLQSKILAKKVIFNQPRPIYIVDSQPIDIDVYLRQYFANKIPQKVMNVTVSAYSSTNSQTDNTPYITAYSTTVRDGIVAANFLPVGTVIRFPDKFGDKLFVVEDRMDERFGMQVDIWMSDQEEAKKFGIQYLKLEVF